MKVRRKTYWVDRYGFIATNKGLVYAKSKNDMKNARYFTLKGKKIMKGKRNNNDEYIAICDPKNGKEVPEVKISFPDRRTLEKWGKIVMEEMDGITQSDKVKQQLKQTLESKPKAEVQKQQVPKPEVKKEVEVEKLEEVQQKPQMQTMKTLKTNKVDKLVEDVTDTAEEIKEAADEVESLVKAPIPTPNVNPLSRSMTSRRFSSKPNQPGYISQFRSYLSEKDKKVMETTQDEYRNRTLWHLDKHSESALTYTSLPERKIPNSRQRVTINDGPSTEQTVQRLAIPAILCIL